MAEVGQASSTKLELAVNIADETSAKQLEDNLQRYKQIHSYQIDSQKQTITIESTLPSSEVTDIVESSGNCKAVITGMGGGPNHENLGAAVAIMHEGNPASGVRGVTRMVQTSVTTCVIDGTLDGLAPSRTFRLAVHEYGDLSEGCDSCGNVLNLDNNRLDTPYGHIGDFTSDINGRTSFKAVSHKIQVWDVIGRSMVLSEQTTSSLWSKLACGIIARSAGLFQNNKKICACDGVTIWDERDVPIAGSARSKKT